MVIEVGRLWRCLVFLEVTSMSSFLSSLSLSMFAVMIELQLGVNGKNNQMLIVKNKSGQVGTECNSYDILKNRLRDNFWFDYQSSR